MKHTNVVYRRVNECPLCSSVAVDRVCLTRQNYFFGQLHIPLPESGVCLRECTNCSLLFKSMMPVRDSLCEIMSASATAVWRKKSGIHPAVSWITPHCANKSISILDIGAANGDLLEQIKPYVSRVSALDIVEYSQCKAVLNGEYIIGEIEGSLNWSGNKYDIVTAFDIFEHFLDPRMAARNITELLSYNGKLIIETGDWDCFDGSLADWYYANLFEHQIFWNRKSIKYFCDSYGFVIQDYRNAVHKNLRDISLFKLLALTLIVKLSRLSIFNATMMACGKGDPTRFSAPSLADHAFIVLERSNA